MTAASGEDIDWDHISTVLGNASDGPQCASRWQKVLHPQTIKGAWTPEVCTYDMYDNDSIIAMILLLMLLIT